MSRHIKYCINICFFVYSVILFSQTKPSDIPGLSLWLIGDSVHSSNLPYIDTVYDYSPNKFDAVQSNGSSQPSFIISSLLNNHKVISLDGVNDFLESNHPVTVGSVFVVSNWLGGGTIFSTNYEMLSRNYSDNSTPPWSIFEPTINTSDWATGSWIIMTNFFKNGVSSSSYAPLSDYKITSGYTNIPTLFQNFMMGWVGIGGRYWNGNIAEVIIYNTIVSTSQRHQIEKYLSDKYAPPVNLGPDIVVNYGFCPLKINAHKDWFTSYQWNTGETTDSIFVTLSASYSVADTNIFGYTSSDTINIKFPGNLNPFHDTTICYNSSLTWNTQLNKSGYSFLWQDGSTDSAYTITKAGKYYVNVTDTVGCSGNSYTLTVNVDSFPRFVSLGPDTSICSGISINLFSGAAQAISYLWSNGSSSSSIAITASGNYSVIVLDANGCVGKDSITVSLKGINPKPGFIANAVCFGDTTFFSDTSFVLLPDHISTWNWNFGDGNNSALPNPSHTYTLANTYTVTLTVVSDSGCSATIHKIDTVNPKPDVLFNYSLIQCSGVSTNFTDQSSVLNGALVSWNWNFGDPSSGTNNFSTSISPSHTYGTAGNYSVKLIVTTNFGCKDSITKVISVFQSPTASFTFDTVCNGNSTHFSDNSFPSIITWLWDFGDGNNAALPNTSHIYASAGNYSVIHTVTSSSGCVSSDTNIVKVYYLPDTKFVGDSICMNAPLQFIDSSSVIGSAINLWNWNFSSSGVSNQQNPIITFTTSGTYSVLLSVTSMQGCVGSATQSIHVMPLPVTSFSFSPQYGAPPLTVNFNNQSSGASNYWWSFGDSGQSDSVNPSHIYQNIGLYVIKLISETKFGCKDSSVQNFKIDKPVLDIAVKSVGINQQPNSIQPYALLYNDGTIDADQIQLSAYLDDGTPVIETTNDTLKPQAQRIYQFNSLLEILSDQKHDIACVDIMFVNGREDDILSNNLSCTAIINDFTLLNPFPNPTNGDIYFLFILPQDGTINAEIYDAIGKKVQSFEVTRYKGLNQIIYNTSMLTNGTYFFKLYYKDVSVGKIFIKE